MEYSQALGIAERIREQLRPFCDRIEIAGSIRRKKPEVKDIEIVAIPKFYQTGIFEDGIARIVNQWEKVKGEMDYNRCKYTQRILPDGIKLDLFFAEPGNWGSIYAIRTGGADYSHKVLANGWVKKGFTSEGGYLKRNGNTYSVREEEELFKLLGIPFCLPENRNI